MLFSHYFEVKTKYDANNLAYTSNFLPLHIDLPFYDYIPGVSGSLLVDDLQQSQVNGGPKGLLNANVT